MVDVKLNMKGLRALMKSREVTSVVVREARSRQQAAGSDFETIVLPGRYTARAFIRPANAAGRKQQADNAVLERILG